MKTTQKGFILIEGLLICAIIALIAGTGYYVWHSKQQTDKTLTSASDVSQTGPKTTSVKTFADCQKSVGSAVQTSYPEVCVTKSGQRFTQPVQVTYLTIKELGVKFTLTSNILDAVYAASSFDSGYYFLSTESLKGTGCDLDNTAGGGFYLRFQSGQMDSETKIAYTDEYPDAIKLGQYYYAYGRNPAASTCSQNTAVQQTADETAKKFKSVLKTIQSAS